MFESKIAEGLLRLGISLPRAVFFAVLFSIIWVIFWKRFRHRRYYWVVWMGVLGLSLFGCFAFAWRLFLIAPLKIKEPSRGDPGGGITLSDLQSYIRMYRLLVAYYIPIWFASFPLSIVFSALAPSKLAFKHRVTILITILAVSGSLFGFTLYKAHWYQKQYEFVMKYR